MSENRCQKVELGLTTEQKQWLDFLFENETNHVLYSGDAGSLNSSTACYFLISYCLKYVASDGHMSDVFDQ